jgi:hypothetical protein
MTELISFEDVLQKSEFKDKQKTILLGNGFSMAFNKERFSFTNLLQSAIDKGIIQKNSEIDRIFKKLNTSDFEKVLHYLKNALDVTSVYFPSISNNKLIIDIENLKKNLVDVIANNHPEKSTDIPIDLSSNCSNFLNNFDKIYTINYDLLSYWVIMQNDLEEKYKDGFGNDDAQDDYVVYQDNKHNSKLSFLHGGLHLFEKSPNVIKVTYSRTGKPLKEQIMNKLDSDIYPVFVSEGTYKEKLKKIRSNYYLNYCYRQFRRLSGVLLIFGTALKSNDEHIKKAIIDISTEEGKLDCLFIGVFDKEKELKDAEKFKEEFESKSSKKKPRKAFLYDATTVNPWGN